MRLAAIDIGSNAVRLLINDIHPWQDGEYDYTKLSFVRVPLRLGFDVFDQGFISNKKISKLADTLNAFKLLMSVYDVEDYRICATSAMRDAQNAPEIIRKIKQETGLQIDVITGTQEARMLFEAFPPNASLNNPRLVYIDVGGGSTEISLYENKTCVLNQSFNVGTIRLLRNDVVDTDWPVMKKFVKENILPGPQALAIGSGGNINKVFSLVKRKKDKPLDAELLNDYFKQMHDMSVEERMHHFDLRADRADVIVPALKIYTAILRWGGIDKILVPQIGLSDGIVHHLFQEKRNA